MEVNCCFCVAHQASSAGERALFTSSTVTMPTTSRTKKTTQEMFIVVFPPLKSAQNTFKTIVDVGSSSSFKLLHRPRHHCGWPCFVTHWRIMTGWSILAQRALARAIVRFMRYHAKTMLTPRGKVTS
jgi:hypothetical protein